jgi:hypothetical protein
MRTIIQLREAAPVLAFPVFLFVVLAARRGRGREGEAPEVRAVRCVPAVAGG